MQSLKDIALMVLEKSQCYFRFSKRGNMSIISIENVQKSKIVVYYHDLLDVINNCTKCQPNRIQGKISCQPYEPWTLISMCSLPSLKGFNCAWLMEGLSI